ncbi:DUF5134 domain-containing protein [Streptomyces sp. HB2AG]|uniref:DUF5134 domain-containing protein n=1 Tax=Streptomyces sp. HB2AG TaxID=2983400 RepID=UPI0022AA03E3|nr:DUF5134 domain-containing protein [Streptomyces sp. HB2AG]MCZ2524914.1 DUF5134 domain-containing protein [Streptomyces sp. HB2AG]
MHGPPLVGWLLVALCAATGTWCLLRMRACRAAAERRDAAAGALMGAGMAVMAVPVTVLDTGTAGAVVFAAVFTAAGLHALVLVRHDRHQVHHAVGAAAMVYMAVVMARGTAGHGGHAAHAAHAAHAVGRPEAAASGLPLVSGLLLVYFAGHALWCVVRSPVPAGVPAVPAAPPALAVGGGATGPGAPGGGTARTADGGPGADAAGAGKGWLLSAPEVAAACRASMAICMATMLLTV